MDTAQKRTFRDVMIYTFLFGIVAHGYRYANMFFSHDSMMVSQTDFANMISIGRFLTPVYLTIRGTYFPPALVGCLGLLFLGVSIYLMVRLLDLTDPLFIILTCGILVTSGTITLINATYLHDIDKYMLSLLLATVSVYLCRRYRHGLFTGGAVMMVSLGIYQSFFQAAVFLHMILAVKDILDGEGVKEVLRRGFKAIGSLLLGLALYAVGIRLALAVSGNALTSDYNSIQHAWEFTGVRNIVYLCVMAVAYVLWFYVNPITMHPLYMGALTVLLGIGSLVMLWRIVAARKWERGARPLLVALIALMPLGMNIIYVISKQNVHELMIFSFYLAYVFALFLLQRYLGEERPLKKSKQWVKRSVCAAMGVLIFYSVVFSNNCYLKKQLEYESTMFAMDRVVDRIEETEGYVPGETPVVFMVTRPVSSLTKNREGLIIKAAGTYDSFSLTYDDTYRWFFDKLLAYPINLAGTEEKNRLAQTPEVQEMPAFPAADSCRIIDGVLVVKLG